MPYPLIREALAGGVELRLHVYEDFGQVASEWEIGGEYENDTPLVDELNHLRDRDNTADTEIGIWERENTTWWEQYATLKGLKSR